MALYSITGNKSYFEGFLNVITQLLLGETSPQFLTDWDGINHHRVFDYLLFSGKRIDIWLNDDSREDLRCFLLNESFQKVKDTISSKTGLAEQYAQTIVGVMKEYKQQTINKLDHDYQGDGVIMSYTTRNDDFLVTAQNDGQNDVHYYDEMQNVKKFLGITYWAEHKYVKKAWLDSDHTETVDDKLDNEGKDTAKNYLKKFFMDLLEEALPAPLSLALSFTRAVLKLYTGKPNIDPTEKDQGRGVVIKYTKVTYPYSTNPYTAPSKDWDIWPQSTVTPAPLIGSLVDINIPGPFGSRNYAKIR